MRRDVLDEIAVNIQTDNQIFLSSWEEHTSHLSGLSRSTLEIHCSQAATIDQGLSSVNRIYLDRSPHLSAVLQKDLFQERKRDKVYYHIAG